MARPVQQKAKAQRPDDMAVPIAGGTLRLHELRSRIFRNTRLVRVWLPPDYEKGGGARYPVLYLNDGQNLFEASTAFGGVHWRVGETATRLILEKKIPPLIIVGIDNTGKNRASEYLPYQSRDPKVLVVKGTSYPKFLKREVMPLVEHRYAVLTGPENTGLGGSSLGGLITLYAQLAAPGIFGRLMIESPSLFVANRRILAECRKFRAWPFRLYLGMGTQEVGDARKDEKVTNDVRELAKILHDAKLGEDWLKVRIEEGAGHSEAAWAARFPDALAFLFPADDFGH
jgi:predicted alpha/beta superfamily hydrolase